MSKIYILNAPPQTGKDTIADLVIAECGVHTCSFKYPMYNLFIHTTGMSASEFFDNYDTPGWKDSSQEFLNGRKPRELMIHISEEYVKPFFGEDYYGKWVADYIKFAEFEAEKEFTWILPDGGFQPEFDAMKKAFGDRVVLISLEREGHRDFTGDSRSYIYDWEKYPENGSVHFDTTEGNYNVINFIKKGMLEC
ncbi:MAG: hypothetical protein ACRC6V_12150 [Bacteroidales bacterium]